MRPSPTGLVRHFRSLPTAIPSGSERTSQFRRNRRTFSMDVSRVDWTHVGSDGVEGEQAGNPSVPRSRAKGRTAPLGASLAQATRGPAERKRGDCAHSARLGSRPLRAGGRRDYRWGDPCTYGTLNAAKSARKRQAFCTKGAKDARRVQRCTGPPFFSRLMRRASWKCGASARKRLSPLKISPRECDGAPSDRHDRIQRRTGQPFRMARSATPDRAFQIRSGSHRTHLARAKIPAVAVKAAARKSRIGPGRSAGSVWSYQSGLSSFTARSLTIEG